MVLISDHVCSNNCNVMMVPKRYRRRPKLLPPKNKRYTRARVNLNQIWPHIDDENFDHSPRLPFQHSNIMKVINLTSTKPTYNHSLGSDVFNYTLENIARINSLDNFSNLETAANSTDSNTVESPSIINKIHYYTTCSNSNLEQLTLQNPPVRQTASTNSIKLSIKNSPFKLDNCNIRMDEIASALHECERDIMSGLSSSARETPLLPSGTSALIENDKENEFQSAMEEEEDFDDVTAPGLLEPQRFISF